MKQILLLSPLTDKETKAQQDFVTCCKSCTPMFIAALFIIARTWKQPRCPSADEWIRKLVHMHHGVSLTVLFISAGPGDQ